MLRYNERDGRSLAHYLDNHSSEFGVSLSGDPLPGVNRFQNGGLISGIPRPEYGPEMESRADCRRRQNPPLHLSSFSIPVSMLTESRSWDRFAGLARQTPRSIRRIVEQVTSRNRTRNRTAYPFAAVVRAVLAHAVHQTVNHQINQPCAKSLWHCNGQPDRTPGAVKTGACPTKNRLPGTSLVRVALP